MRTACPVPWQGRVGDRSAYADSEAARCYRLSIRECSAAVGVVLHVNGVVHGGGGGVRFFVGGDVGLVLHGGADVVEAFEQNFLARRSDFELEHQTVSVRDGLVGQIDGQRIAFFFFGASEKLVDFSFGERGGQDAVLETIVVENVGVAGCNNNAEAVVLHAPRRVFAAGAATEVGARQQNRRAFVARKIQNECRVGPLPGQIAPVVKKYPAESFARQRFQELLGHHLIGVHVDAIERHHHTSVR